MCKFQHVHDLCAHLVSRFPSSRCLVRQLVVGCTQRGHLRQTTFLAYISFLVFHFWSHAGQYNRTSDAAVEMHSSAYQAEDLSKIQSSILPDNVADLHASSSIIGTPDSTMSTSTDVPPSNGSRHDLENSNGHTQDVSEEERKPPRLSIGMSMVLLLSVTAVSVSVIRNLPTINFLLA